MRRSHVLRVLTAWSVALLLALMSQPAALAVPGTELWIRRYNGPANRGDSATALGVAPNGSKVFVTGSSVAGSWQDYATVAYDASTGAELWVKRYMPNPTGNDVPTALSVAPDGSTVFVTGWSSDGGSILDYATIAYDASTGAELWVKRYNGPGNGGDVPASLGVAPDGTKVFVTGRAYGGSSSHFDYGTVAYDASTGAELWAQLYDGPSHATDGASALGVAPDGTTVFVTGGIQAENYDYDYATIAYDASTGGELWVKRYDGPANGSDLAISLGVAPDGAKVFVTGESSGGNSSGNDYATIAHDASTGGELWVQRYTGFGNGGDLPTSLRVAPDGTKVFVTGESWGGSSGLDYATVAHDASTGATLWAKRFGGGLIPRDDSATALGVSPDGTKVFVTGESVARSLDYATIAYDASTGATMWVKRFGSVVPGQDNATALGVAPDGTKVFVTGQSNSDYVTIAYSVT